MEDDKAMLQYLNFSGYEDLFADIPAHIRKKEFALNTHYSEYGLIKEALSISEKNTDLGYTNFLGCGVYDRIIPSSVDSIISRSEFLTAYTPYQAEISQGMLQSLFEYQSIISDLFGMDAANSSMYDGPTALGESVRMAVRVNDKHTILLPDNLYRNKRRILENYTAGLGIKFKTYAFDMDTGMLDLNDLASKVDDSVSAVIIENPNSFGILDENALKVKRELKDQLLISYVDPISLGAIRNPGSYGADIAVAEGQQLGIHQNYGGPYLGIFTFRKDLSRKSPGRLIGETVDSSGKRGYVMTLQTREQHIRREKATSNICTNQALMALAALSYLSILGSEGLRKVALATINRSKALKAALSDVRGVETDLFSGTSFSDVPLCISTERKHLEERLREDLIFGGLKLSDLMENSYTKLEDAYFFSVTEKTTPLDINKLRESLEGLQ